ncbi:MAG: UDP-N-acetylmuramate dehydrogenase [Chloroflexi bacterium]|nr:UDP-N-acetylmuramate dehydrogenase [Chloroflexota bacterium]
MLSETFLSQLQRIAPVRREEPLALHVTLRIGGPAEAYLQARGCRQLRQAAALAHQWEAPLFLLGAGSNLLVSDRGLRGLVVETWANRDAPLNLPSPGQPLCPEAMPVWAFAGTPLPRLARRAARAGLAGLEWAVGIPGTVAGGVVNNAGAHGGDMAGVVRSVLVATPAGERVLDPADLDFGYRQSVFRQEAPAAAAPGTILAVELALTRDAPEAIQARMAQYADYRRSTQPSQRSVGSIFKNPEGFAAGWLIEQTGLKGQRAGDAQISSKHANFIVNRGHATAAAVEELILLAQDAVRETFGLTLELEIQRVGEGS